MALLRELVVPLMLATQRNLEARTTPLPPDDLSGVAVLLGVAAELLRVEPRMLGSEEPVEVATLRLRAQDGLEAVRRATRRDGGSS